MTLTDKRKIIFLHIAEVTSVTWCDTLQFSNFSILLIFTLQQFFVIQAENSE